MLRDPARVRGGLRPRLRRALPEPPVRRDAPARGLPGRGVLTPEAAPPAAERDAVADPQRWATFDCYGTLIDWNRGIGAALARLWPGRDRDGLLSRYHEIEPRIQAATPSMTYREVLTSAVRELAREERLPLPGLDADVLARTLPDWPPFPEVPGTLELLRARGWRLGILSNTDPDLLAASIGRLGVQPDVTVTAADAGSYKPAHGHWLEFRRRTGVSASRHVHVAASLFHDVAPCAELGIATVWINRLGESSDLPRASELSDLSGLPATLDRVIAGA